MNLSENALIVLKKRYLKRDENGNVLEKPEDMFLRVAKTIAEVDLMYNASDGEVEKLSEDFYNMMIDLQFLPNTPTLINAGRELQQLSACFSLVVNDSMEAIFDTLKSTALIFKSGGGVGLTFSKLRPKGDLVSSTIGVSSGPVSFMEVFDKCVEIVKQGGVRRGAALGLLRVDHPDILEFIQCKKDTKKFHNFNISVAVTDKFFECLQKNEMFELVNYRTNHVTQISAKEIFDAIVDSAWSCGDPGLFFIDEVNRHNPIINERIEGVNPCGEQPLLPFESCNLGSINLLKILEKEEDRYIINWEKFKNIIHKSVHFLDNVIDANKYPLKEIEIKTKQNRKIGLGIMGFAQFLFALQIPYNSEEAIQISRKISEFLTTEAMNASRCLAEVRGSFSNIDNSIYKGQCLRNATVTTIAPTGTLSMIAECSSGIEPVFALCYKKTVLDNTPFIYQDTFLVDTLKNRGLYSTDLMQDIEKTGSIQKMNLPEDIKRVFVTSHDISYDWHVKIQAAFQEHIHNAVSKTINFPNDATREDIREAYLLAYRLKCKGITVFRDGCIDEQVLTKVVDTKKQFVRDNYLYGVTFKKKTGCGSLYVTINSVDKKPLEVFVTAGKAGGCFSSQTEAIGRLISGWLREGGQLEEIIKQLKGIKCNSIVGFGSSQISSCADAVAHALMEYLNITLDKKVEV